jgi:hypothetical protein
MQLPESLRENLVLDTDAYIEALQDNPSPEAITAYILEYFEIFGDDVGIDDILSDIEDASDAECSLAEFLEDELESNEEMVLTGEEVICVIEGIVAIDWIDDGEFKSIDEVLSEEDL